MESSRVITCLGISRRFHAMLSAFGLTRSTWNHDPPYIAKSRGAKSSASHSLTPSWRACSTTCSQAAISSRRSSIRRSYRPASRPAVFSSSR
ncbi:hypothetical protein [Streptomyces mirabilis]|uniref:hypothetical protein n=1 Tax=Streptomyces mirabilis TaxID=68239 RepID=UPI0036E82EEA